MLLRHYLDLIQMSWISEVCVCLDYLSNIYLKKEKKEQKPTISPKYTIVVVMSV